MNLFSFLSIFDYIGFAGTGILILAFTCAALVEGFSAGAKFLWMNVLGSFLLLFCDAYRGSYASLGIGMFWIVVSAKALANKNVLDPKSLKVSTIAFNVYVLGLLYHTVFMMGLSGEELMIKVVSIVIIEVMMLSYMWLISGRIRLALYLAIAMGSKILFLPCLLLESNTAAMVLHAYGVIVAAGGLVRLALPQRFRMSAR